MMLPKNKREYATMLARTRADALRGAAAHIRHWIGPEPTREEIAEKLELWMRNHNDDVTFAETVQGADVRFQINGLIRRLEPR